MTWYTLEYFYREMSGGLLLEGLDLYSRSWDREAEINEEYRRLGCAAIACSFRFADPMAGWWPCWW